MSVFQQLRQQPAYSPRFRAWPGVLVVLCAAALFLTTRHDYGVSWDEPSELNAGQVSYRYVFEGDTALMQLYERFYGAGYSLPLATLENWTGARETHQAYRLRHLASHLFFLGGCLCGYFLALRLFRRQAWALVALSLLLLHPRIYAHSVFNTKDLPFVTVTTACMLAAHHAFASGRIRHFVVLGLLCGWATGIRIIGVLLPACVLVVLVARVLAVRDGRSMRHAAVAFGGMIVAAAASLYVCWPFLWSDPLGRFAESWDRMAHYPWGGSLLFRGTIYKDMDVPWTYIPIWFAITTPLLWIAAGLAGAGLTVGRALKALRTRAVSAEYCSDVLHLLIVFVPVAAVIALHSIVYDDWRHLYFIWPPFAMLAVRALQWADDTRARWMVRIAIVAQAIAVLLFSIRNHPFQQVYFNVLAPHGKEQRRYRYEMDYWGVGFRQAYDFILTHDTARHITVLNSLPPLEGNLAALPPTLRRRIALNDTPEASDYFITNFRLHPEDFPLTDIAYERRVEDNTILRVYRLRPSADSSLKSPAGR